MMLNRTVVLTGEADSIMVEETGDGNPLLTLMKGTQVLRQITIPISHITFALEYVKGLEEKLEAIKQAGGWMDPSDCE